MASVTKPKGAKTWIAQYRIPLETDPSGRVRKWKQISKSTGIENNRTEAQKVATRMEDEARRHVSGDASSEEMFRVITRAVQLREQGKLTEAATRELVAELYRGPDGQRLHFYSITGWLEEWLGRRDSKLAPRTVGSYRKAVGDFLTFLGPVGAQRLETLSEDRIEAWQQDLLANGTMQSTVNLKLRIIRIAFRAAVSSKLITESPTDRVAVLPEDDSSGREPFTAEEIGRLYRAAADYDPAWGMVVLLGAYTGLRLRDCTGLKRASLDAASGVLRVQPQKQQRSRKKKTMVIPLHPSLAKALEEFKTEDPVLFFPGLAHRRNLSDAFQVIMRRAGVDRKLVRRKGEGGALRDIGQKSFHSLRHAANSLMANAGVSQQERREIMGHASDTMNSHYTHFELERLRKAVAVLPDISTVST